MACLPPVGWADIARRSDIVQLDEKFDALEQRVTTLDHKFDEKLGRIEQRILESEAGVYKAMYRMTWTMATSMIVTVFAAAGFAFTAGTFL